MEGAPRHTESCCCSHPDRRNLGLKGGEIGAEGGDVGGKLHVGGLKGGDVGGKLSFDGLEGGDVVGECHVGGLEGGHVGGKLSVGGLEGSDVVGECICHVGALECRDRLALSRKGGRQGGERGAGSHGRALTTAGLWKEGCGMEGGGERSGAGGLVRRWQLQPSAVQLPLTRTAGQFWGQAATAAQLAPQACKRMVAIGEAVL